MTSMIEQLLDMEQTLKGWIGIDNMAAFKEAARQDAEHIPAYAAGASSEAVVAGTLHSIEIAARLLRESLHITFTGAAWTGITGGTMDPPRPAQGDPPSGEGQP